MQGESASTSVSVRGQRRGFYWQDWFAAWQMLRSLIAPGEGIVAVAVESTDPNGLDDVVVYRHDSITYYQLKHTVDSEGKFTGTDLFGALEKGTPLIGKLYHAFGVVRGTAGSRRIEVRVHTNADGSGHHKNLLIAPGQLDRRILQPIRRGEWPLDEESDVLEKIRTLVGAPDLETLRRFLEALHLDFQAPDEEAIRQEVHTGLQSYLHRSSSQVEADAEAWLGRVYDRATRDGGGHPLPKSEIERELRQLLHAPRLSEHRLALPEHHVPRQIVAAQILDMARRMSQGYLIVLGHPGSGKTTLATWIADEHDDELLLRYHVFDPDRSAGLQLRSRASGLGFVRAMSDVLSERFPSRIRIRIPSEDQLEETLDSLFRDLEQLASTGRTRLVIIDGIDHIVRLGLSQESLFETLPRENFPAGVVFILFGQPDWDYPDWLIQSAQVLHIPPFSPEETRQHVCQRFGWEPTDPGVAPLSDLLHDRTSGNPLSLFYNLVTVSGLVEELHGSLDEVLEVLQSRPLFGALPHQEYERLLAGLKSQRKVPDNSETLWNDLLGCLAVASTAVTPTRLSNAFSDDGMSARQAKDYLEGLRPVVVERAPGEFWLFHDDFRRYLEELPHVAQGRKAAHRRLAHALKQDWTGDELGSLAEHAWLGGDYEYLVELPYQRELAYWFQAASPHVVVGVHRLALAAAFALGDETAIMRIAYTATLAAEIADLPFTASNPPRELGLRGWSFVASPRDEDSRSLARRAPAIHAAASGYIDDPGLAAEIAGRFLIPMEKLGTVVKGDWHAEHDYLEALTRWLLTTGDTGPVRELIGNEHCAPAVTRAVEEEVLSQTDADIIRVWLVALVGRSLLLDRALVGTAVSHLNNGSETVALCIADVIAHSEETGIEFKRDARVLLSLSSNELMTKPGDQDAGVRWDEHAEISDATEWREFFFHGFATTASGKQPELVSCSFPIPFVHLLSRGLDDSARVVTGRSIWRAGCAAGLAVSGEFLLTSAELLEVLSPLLGESVPKEEHRARYLLDRCSRVFLPLLTRAVSVREPLALAMKERLVAWAQAHLTSCTNRLYGVLEAIWILAPETWRQLAQEATAEQFLPGTDWSERREWFEYWRSKTEARGVPVPADFRARVTKARLGVPRKSYPAEAAVELVCTNLEHPAFVDRLRRLTDLLIRLDGEPEGGRGAYLHLSRLFAAALKVDSALFEEQFNRCVVLEKVAEPFGALPGDIVAELIRGSADFTADELVVFWHWLAASPGSFESNSYDPLCGDVATANQIVQLLESLGCSEDAGQIREWLPGLAPPERLATSSDSEPRFVPEQRQTPSINDVRPAWFAPWYDGERFQVLRDYLATNGEDGWREVCALVAARIADSSSLGGHESLAVAENMASLRPSVSREDALELALRYAEEKVQFQPLPLPAQLHIDPGHSRLESIVRLIARGLDVGDVETVRRTLRSMRALIRRPGTRTAVTQELAGRFGVDDDRSLTYVLALLRESPILPDEVLTIVRGLQLHPNIWCRWYACFISGVTPEWGEPRRIETKPGIVAPGQPPIRKDLGAAFYGDTTGAREAFITQLLPLMPPSIDEDTLRAWLELELSSLGAVYERPTGWHSPRGGHELASTGVGSAAGRLATRLASLMPSDKVPTLLAAVARFDPWLALADPIVESPTEWVELCLAERRVDRERVTITHRSLGLIPTDALAGPSAVAHEVIAEAACSLLFPQRPNRYAWVAASLGSVRPPQMREAPVIPLAFMNRPFMELQVAQFELVPMFGWHPFQALSFEVHPVPRWVHPRLGPVIVAARSESQADSWRSDRHVNWWTGWYVSPDWLASILDQEISLVRFWRRASGPSQGGDPVSTTVEFGLEVLHPNSPAD